MRKEKNTIEIKETKKEKNDKKILYIFAFVILASCSTVKEKASGLKEIGKITKECPPKEERTLKHIFCKENK